MFAYWIWWVTRWTFPNHFNISSNINLLRETHLSAHKTTQNLYSRLLRDFHGKWKLDPRQWETLHHKVRAWTHHHLNGVSDTFANAKKIVFHSFIMPGQLRGQHQSCACQCELKPIFPLAVINPNLRCHPAHPHLWHELFLSSDNAVLTPLRNDSHREETIQQLISQSPIFVKG